jgi:hypothetical protein
MAPVPHATELGPAVAPWPVPVCMSLQTNCAAAWDGANRGAAASTIKNTSPGSFPLPSRRSRAHRTSSSYADWPSERGVFCHKLDLNGESPEQWVHLHVEPDMTTYPLEFHRRSEQKWALRAQASSARETTPRAARVGHSQRGQRSAGLSERRDILGRSPWLREIGQCLRAEYDAVDHPVPEHLTALLKELKGRRR